MMMSLFSVFDPVSVMGLSLNWLALGLFLVVFPGGLYNVKGRLVEVYTGASSVVSIMFKDISYPNFLGLVFFCMGVFMMLSVNNVMGLFPFVFTSTSHLMVTMGMGVVMWMMSFIMGWMNSFKVSSAHLVPEGAPLILAPFMVLIESISHLIRPVTLSVRLAANMMAGHLIIGLISSISMSSWGGFLVSVLLQSLMLLLEWAVVFIQAFVFSVLVMLYSLEMY